MTKQDVVNLHAGLNALGSLTGVRFAYAVSKNLSMLKSEVEAITKAGQTYEQNRVYLAELYSKKDELGKPIMVNNQFQLDNVTGFTDALKDLQKQDDYKNYQELLSQPSDFVPYKIKLSDLPETITAAQMNSIIDIVEE